MSLESKFQKRLSIKAKYCAPRTFNEEFQELEQSAPSNAGPNKRDNGKIKKTKTDPKVTPYKKVNEQREKKHVDQETDPIVLERRQKQINYGKNTLGYENYRKLVPITKREPDDPQTPVKYHKYTRRGWDGLIRIWRQKLHAYDPSDKDEVNSNDDVEADTD